MCVSKSSFLIPAELTPASFISFQNDALLSFLTIQESLTYTALLSLQKCSNSVIKKKVCILSSSTKNADMTSCNAFTDCFMFKRFPDPYSAAE